MHYTAGTGLTAPADVTYGYDANGRVKTRVDGSGTSTYTYDDLGHLTSVVNTAGGGTISYTYDLAGALKTMVNGIGTTTYGYDNAHQLTSMNYPQSTSTLLAVFANNGDGRRTDAWMQSNSTHTVWAAHSHTAYDSSGRVTHVTGQTGPATGPTTVLDQSACYAAGSVAPACSTATTADRSKLVWIKDNLTGEVTSYGYDDHARLTTTTVTGGTNPRTFTFGYDAAGNRTSASVTGTSPTSQTLTFNAGNQITSTGYSYDGSGNQTAAPARTATPNRTVTFNAAGQQTQAAVGSGASASTSTYTYAGTNQNEVLSETATGATASTYTLTYGRPDAQGLPEIESVGYHDSQQTGTGYVFHDPTGAPVMLQSAAGVTCLYMYDITGSPTALTTSYNTISYTLLFDPYGAAVRTDGGSGNGGTTYNPYLFHRGIQDRVTKLLKFGGRWYDTSLGSWTQQDQLNAPLDPANANRYAYVADDPINNLDPTGQVCTASDFYESGFEIFTGFFTTVGGVATSEVVVGIAGTVVGVALIWHATNRLTSCSGG